MIALPLVLTLTEPILATALAGDPNSATTYPFIPGSLIRGALATRYAAQHSGDIALDPAARRLFFESVTRFLNAYPLDSAGQRTLPTPLGWVMKKGTEAPTPLYNLAMGESRPDYPRNLGKPYCQVKGNEVKLFEPVRRFNVHTRRENRVMGRAVEDEGNVFRYEALAEGQQFGTVILLEQSQDYDALKPFLTGHLFLGASRGASYGRVAVQVGPPVSNWREVAGQGQAIPANQSFTLTLLSDLVVKDVNGQFSVNLPITELAKQLGVPSLEVVKSFREIGLVGGFNQKWGLALPQAPVIRAGSVFVLSAAGNISLNQIQALEARGVGLRRGEGFGRVAINGLANIHPLRLVSSTPVKAKPQTTPLPPQLQSLDENDSRTLAQTITRRLGQARLDGALTDYLDRLRFEVAGLKPSQPNRLRVLIRSLLAQADQANSAQAVNTWLKDLKKPALRQFETAQVNSIPLKDWLENRVKNPEKVWDELGAAPDKWPQPAVAGAKPAEDPTLALTATLRLVDGVLARLAKEAKKND
ncbi:MAG: CRISPR-associated RAMP protein Csx10 [Anaerolineae bacterium]|nr:hypothetical protein [Anaerolineales bacterium]MCQ3975846.1 hypothetical protein [Anaerolineae bacterium]